MRIKITNLAIQKSVRLELTSKQTELLKGILFNGNYFIEVDNNEKKCMNIHSKVGDKVVVTEWSKNNGPYHDIKKVSELLEVGKVYEIAYIQVYIFSTDVQVKGVDVTFNAANFEDYIE